MKHIIMFLYIRNVILRIINIFVQENYKADMGNEYFKFKQFIIKQEKCGMKVGTDGVLLGAWTDTREASNIADIGTGTGLIAIMLAQKCGANITGIEINEDAAIQAKENMDNTLWHDRLNAVKADINDYYLYNESKFDLIVSNPPFFIEDVKGYSEKRNMARHTDSLDFTSLVKAVSYMLTSDGRFCVILPATCSTDFIGEAIKTGLVLTKRTEIITKPGVKPKRILMEFCKGHKNAPTEFSQLLLSANGEKTDEYIELTKDYYL